MTARGVSELVLVVSDVASVARFYREVVGLTAASESEDWAWFHTGTPGSSAYLAVTRAQLLYEEHSPHPPGKRWGPVHFALRVDRADLAASVERVRGAQVEVHGPQRLEWMQADSYYFYDPAGNLVEFWSPDP